MPQLPSPCPPGSHEIQTRKHLGSLPTVAGEQGREAHPGGRTGTCRNPQPGRVEHRSRPAQPHGGGAHVLPGGSPNSSGDPRSLQPIIYKSPRVPTMAGVGMCSNQLHTCLPHRHFSAHGGGHGHHHCRRRHRGRVPPAAHLPSRLPPLKGPSAGKSAAGALGLIPQTSSVCPLLSLGLGATAELALWTDS